MNIHIETYRALKERGKLAPQIDKILDGWFLSTASNAPVMEVTPDESEAKPVSLKDMVKKTVAVCEIDLEVAKLMGGFKPFEVDKVYESVKKDTATSKSAIYKIMMDLIK